MLSCIHYYSKLCVPSYSMVLLLQEGGELNLQELALRVMSYIRERPYLEARHPAAQAQHEDEGLVGLLHLATSVFKHNPPAKADEASGQVFLLEVFDCIFALPSPDHPYLPKCKSAAAKEAAYDLIEQMAKGCTANYILLHEKVLRQHTKGSTISPEFSDDFIVLVP
jgi:ubiquitin carboxyl-terminal hydrolase 34